ncbi:MAG: nucleotidyltransferase family protein [Methanoregula sp.]|nr:nucleotidyltransferase family protein [Methanoregula sp.]
MQSPLPAKELRPSVISLLTNHRDTIKDQFRVRRIGIFGSVIRGEEHDDSDVDILVDFEHGQATLRNYMSLRRYIQSLFKRDVDLVTTGSLSPYIRPYVEQEVIWIAER